MATMLAGRDLDIAVAREMWAFDDAGWPLNEKEWQWWGTDEDGARYVRCPQFSTTIADAWEVVERLKDRHAVEITWGGDEDPEWHCTITAHGYRPFQARLWKADGATAPLAICLAVACPTDSITAPDEG